MRNGGGRAPLTCAQVYKARDKSKWLWIEHWKLLLDALQLLERHAYALTPLEARLLFFWSQAVVRDELKCRQRSVSLVFSDFVEVRPRAPPLATCMTDRFVARRSSFVNQWVVCTHCRSHRQSCASAHRCGAFLQLHVCFFMLFRTCTFRMCTY